MKLKHSICVRIALCLLVIISCKKEDPQCAAPNADFTYTGADVAAPATVTFTNASTNSGNYLWDFGDGSTSTLDNAAHVYTIHGSYQVKLTATGKCGIDTTTQVIKIN